MRPLRVLVADDSPTARMLLVEILASDPAITVVGQAADGAEAVAMALRLRPDLITMDIEMPGVDGLEATERIMVSAPTPIIIVSSAARGRESKLSLDATEAGALCVVAKPEHPLAPDFERQRRELLSTAKSMAQVKVVRRWSRGARITPVEVRDSRVAPGQIRIVAMAASTGGPATLHQLLGRLPATFGAPVLVVQHIALGFVTAFTEWLDAGCAMRVKVAEHREPLRSGTVYVAPDGSHLRVDRQERVELGQDAAVGGFRPSATCLFQSVAEQYGKAAVGVILTGMGGDGVDGLRRLRAAGAPVLAQDEASSIVYGMPGEAVRAGIVTTVTDPRGIAERLMSYVMGRG